MGNRSLTVAAQLQSRARQQALPRIGCVGRISPEKGQLDFVKAAARIHSAVPDTRFVVVGSALFDDEAARAYDRQVREAAAGLPVEFTGWVDDVYTVLEKLDLLLVPSRWDEPNPRVILEAFAAGVPVIAFARGGIPEIIEHGRTGFLCSDTESMAAQAVDLFQTGQRLGEVAAAAHELWRTQFTRERWQEQMIAAIERCAALQCEASAAIVSA